MICPGKRALPLPLVSCTQRSNTVWVNSLPPPRIVPMDFKVLQAVRMCWACWCCAPVPSLLALVSPAAIIWRIRAVVVNAVDRVCWGWPWAHVGQERRKVAEPASTYEDPASSVGWKFRVVAPQAARLHSVPCPIFGRLASSPCVAVLEVASTSFGNLFAHQASTRARRARMHGDDSFFTTITTCCPVPARTFLPHEVQEYKTAPAFSGSVAWCWPHIRTIAQSVYTKGEWA